MFRYQSWSISKADTLYEKWQASCGFMFCQSRDWICREGCSDSLCPKTPLHTLSDLGRTNQEDVGLALNSHFLQSRSRRMLDIVGFVWLKYVWLDSVWCSCVKKFESALRLRIRDIWDTPLATRVFGTPREGVETHWCQSLKKLTLHKQFRKKLCKQTNYQTINCKSQNQNG